VQPLATRTPTESAAPRDEGADRKIQPLATRTPAEKVQPLATKAPDESAACRDEGDRTKDDQDAASRDDARGERPEGRWIKMLAAKPPLMSTAAVNERQKMQ
jgi:hypothetical protein